MKESSPWWLGLIQGLVALGLGLYILVDSQGAVLILGVIGAIYLLVAGIIDAVRGLGLRSATGDNAVLIRGVIGLAVGGILLLLAFFDLISLQTGYTILAIGLIVFGAFGMYTSVFKRGRRAFEWGPLLVNAALVLWGILVFIDRNQEANLVSISAWILIGIGVVILIWTFLMRGDTTDETAVAP